MNEKSLTQLNEIIKCLNNIDDFDFSFSNINFKERLIFNESFKSET